MTWEYPVYYRYDDMIYIYIFQFLCNVTCSQSHACHYMLLLLLYMVRRWDLRLVEALVCLCQASKVVSSEGKLFDDIYQANQRCLMAQDMVGFRVVREEVALLTLSNSTGSKLTDAP